MSFFVLQLKDLKASVMSSENKNKSSSIIKPPVKQKQSVVSKEQQILEEIKKKEKKIEENIQKIMTERQLKAEQNKKFVFINDFLPFIFALLLFKWHLLLI